MPILASSTYVHGYGKPAIIAVESGAANLNSMEGTSDVFVVKYNTLGKSVWSARIASTATDTGFGIATDSSGNAYVTGQGGSGAVITAFNSDGTAFLPLTPNAGSNDIFVVKYNPSGFVQWIARIASNQADVGYGIATDSGGNVYVVSICAGVTAFNSDGTAHPLSRSSVGGSDAWIVKYNTSGTVQWIAQVGSTATDTGFGIATDSSGNVYVTGQGGSNVVVSVFNWDQSPFGTSLPNSGSNDAFIVKFNTSGVAQWVARVASTGSDTSRAIATDSNGNVYATGRGGFGAVITAFNSDGTAFATTLANIGREEAWVVKYNTSGTVQWVAQIVSVNTDQGNGIATDSDGNVYVTGSGAGTVTAYNSNGTAFATTLPNSGGSDAFVVKYDTTGTVQWVARIATTSADEGSGIATDLGGNVYVTGFSGAANVTAFNSDGTAFATSVPTSGNIDAFIVKYNTSGAVQWITRLASPLAERGYGVTTDSSGDVFVTGNFIGLQYTIYGHSLSLFANVSFSSGNRDAFIVKYNTSGTPQWVTTVGGAAQDIGYGVATDSIGNVYVMGQGGGTGTLTVYNSDGTAFATTISMSGVTDSFIVKYNTSGTALWVARVSGDFAERGRAIATDSAGNVYVTGQGGDGIVRAFSSDGTAFGTTLANAGQGDAFVVKYTTGGTVEWVARVASTGIDIGYGVATDLSGNVYVTGQGGSGVVVTAYNSSGTAFAPTLIARGSNDVWIVKYNTSGSVQWIAQIGSTATDIGYGIATDSNGNVYVTGAGGSATVTAYNSNGTAFATTLANGGLGDAFIVKYNTSGTVQWVAQMVTNAIDIGYGIATDSNGNVYVTSGCGATGVTLFNSNGTSFPLTSLNFGNGDAIIAKYNTNGIAQWIAQIGSGVADIGYGIATDSNGNVYVTGQSSAATTVYGISSNRDRFTELYGASSFVVKYDTNGIGQWIQPLGGSPTLFAISVDSIGNTFVTGNTGTSTATQVFNADRTPYKVISSKASQSAFVVKYSSNTTPLWVAQIASTLADTGHAIATDSDGNVYVTGAGAPSGTAAVVAYNSDGTAFGTTLANAGQGDAFVVKYNTSGSVQWVTRIASTQQDIGYGIKTDSSGNVYVVGGGSVGSLASVVVFNSDGTTFQTLDRSGGGDVFIVKYNTSGTAQWAARIASSQQDVGYAIAIDGSNNVYVTGQGGLNSTQTITAYNSNGTAFATTLVNDSGGGDAFVAKYNTNGTVQWIARIASAATDTGFGIATDPAGDVYVTGGLGGGAVITAYNSNGTAFGTTLANAGLSDTFIVKYSTSGTVQWVTRIASTDADIGYGIAVDGGYNVYVTGQGGASTVTAYNSNGTAFATTLPNSGGGDAFLVKYNSVGTVRWVAQIGGGQRDIGFAITTDSAGNVYVIGQGGTNDVIVAYNSNGTAFGSATIPVTVLNISTFMVKYNSLGAVQWISMMNGSGADSGRGIALDTGGNIYATGSFNGSALVPYSA
jgi:sugar lactone lactonase YvrE